MSDPTSRPVAPSPHPSRRERHIRTAAIVTGVIVFLLVAQHVTGISLKGRVRNARLGYCTILLGSPCYHVPFTTIEEATEGLGYPVGTTVAGSVATGEDPLRAEPDRAFDLTATLRLSASTPWVGETNHGATSQPIDAADAEQTISRMAASSDARTTGASKLKRSGATKFTRYEGQNRRGKWTAFVAIGPHGGYVFITAKI